ncbi:MAG: serine/threonine-protein kinase [Thermoguttaceae bacterium]
MPLNCPYCGHPMTVRRAKPGRYAPACKGCSRKVLLVVPAGEPDPLSKISVHPLQSSEPTAADSRTKTAGPAADPLAATSQWTPAEDRTRTAPPQLPSAGGQSVPGGLNGAAPPDDLGPPSVPEKLGGYRIVRLLGKGAMGTVYLARQVSLDRDVALKTIHRHLSQDPILVARFTREAYAAARLQHHNAVQIYDLGVDQNTHYFSMEYVDGQPLSWLVKRCGRLDPKLAAGYVLQAARALKYAHDHGMVHRDVKPGNILLSRQGVVKVADLGIVKLAPGAGFQPPASPASGPGAAPSFQPAAEKTLSSRIMGTPAYMAPEQSEDATQVDARADIYSLGCTLYDLLTGRPPFQGASAEQIMTKHRTEPAVRPELLVEGVPNQLSAIVMKMMAKNPKDRYQDLGEVIQQLERFLGIAETDPMTRWEQYARTVEDCARRFSASPMARLRSRILLGLFAGCTLLVLLAVFLGSLLFTLSVLGVALAAAGSYFLVSGLLDKTFLFRKFRALVLGCGWRDWLTGIGTLGLLGLVLWVFGVLGTWLFVLALALAGAVAFYALVDRRVARDRDEPLGQVQEVLRALRLAGEDETAVRQFIARHSGPHWEEFFEALFGYEAKLAARLQWGCDEDGRPRKRFRAWRDPIVRWIDQRLQARQEAQKRRHLQQVEEKRLLAEGASAPEARWRAQAAAEAFLAPTPHQPPEPALTGWQAAQQYAQRKRLCWLAAATELLYWIFAFLFGQRMRLVLGSLLIAGCALWAHQNGMIRELTQQDLQRIQAHWEKLRETVQQEPGSLIARLDQLAPERSGQFKPLHLPWAPEAITNLFDSFNPGLAGLILAISVFIPGLKVSVFLFPAAAVMLLAHTTGIPGLLEPAGNSITSLAIGLVLALAGFIFGKES